MLINSDGTNIELYDSKSCKVFARIKLTNEQLAQVLSRLHRTDCEIEVDNLDVIDKQMEHKRFVFEINNEMRTSKSALNQHCLKSLKAQGMSEWIPESNYASQDTFFTENGKHFARTTIRKWQ